MYNEHLRLFCVSQPEQKQEVIVLCYDNSCYVAVYKRNSWYVPGPAGALRYLRKKVIFWMPRPQLPEEEFHEESCV